MQLWPFDSYGPETDLAYVSHHASRLLPCVSLALTAGLVSLFPGTATPVALHG
jgi:hypothetical protein